MITERDLDEAIAECQGQRNPDSKTCMMLAAFLTIKKELFPNASPGYSFAAAPPETPTTYISGSNAIGKYGMSDFLQAVSGLPETDAWGIMDDLMDTVKTIAPRLYRGVMYQISEKREPDL